MITKKLYKRLQNGKSIQVFHKITSEISYTIRISSVEKQFQLHIYHFEGNDVFEDNNYKDERIRKFDSINDLILTLEQDFPTLNVESLIN